MVWRKEMLIRGGVKLTAAAAFVDRRRILNTQRVTGAGAGPIYEWYRVDKSHLDPDLYDKFVQLDADEETRDFLSSSIDKSTWVWTQIWYLLAKAVLKHFWSITDING
ncbi:hypothetical protein ACJJTC_014582, partial [Scirpophaga incertulas]